MKRPSLPRPSQFDSIIRERLIDVKRNAQKKADFSGVFSLEALPDPVLMGFYESAAAPPLQMCRAERGAELVLHHTNTHAPPRCRERQAHCGMQLDRDSARARLRL